MLHLCFAPSLDLLVPKTLKNIRSVWKDPFKPPAVIVPNPAVGKWLRMQLASYSPGDNVNLQPFGCLANLEMQTLERFLWSFLKPSAEMQMLNVECFSQVICGLLEKPFLDHSVCISLRTYLTSSDGEIDPLKRVQVSIKIAHQFLEYEFNRPSVWDEDNRSWRKKGIDATWLMGRDYYGKDVAHEGWQRELYTRAIECLKAGHSDDGVDSTRYISLPHLYRLRREESAKVNQPWGDASKRDIFLFGETRVSHFHRNTLVEISQIQGVDLQVYLTNPCAEFWEDVQTQRSVRVRRIWKHDSDREDAGISQRQSEDYNKEELYEITDLPRDHALLELWGNAGKENIFLWCPQALWNFNYSSPEWIESETGPDSLLKALQYSLLRREDQLPVRKEGWHDDGSLRILACPDPGREIEEIREQILDMAYAGTVEQLNGIVVYLPDPGAYIPSIQRVFGAFREGEPGHISFTVLGAPGKGSLFTQGMKLFLELVDERFNRANVFALLRNPIIQSSLGISSDRVAVWERWAEDLGIFRGYDSEHRKEMGDRGQAVTDAHTFRFGIDRMLIGNLAAGPVHLSYRLIEESDMPTEVPPFRDFDTTDHDLLEAFCSTIEQLYIDIRRFSRAVEVGLHEAIGVLTELVWTWFGDISDETAINSAAEGRVRREFIDSLPLIATQSDVTGRKNVGCTELLALITNCLPDEIPAGSTAWTGGITFAPLKPSMIVPHTVVFIAGLDAASFPGTGDRSSWDLLSSKRIIGDSDSVRDNRFAFLEALHAAKQRLILSYRARNMQKEEVLQPASVVLELEAFLKNQGLKNVDNEGNENCEVRKTVPWIVHESLEEVSRMGRKHGSWHAEEIRIAQLGAEGPKVTHRHELLRKVDSTSTGESLLKTDINGLRIFFTNPLEYHLSKTLGIEIDEEAETISASDEPLESGNLALSILQKAVWQSVLSLQFPKEPHHEIVSNEVLIEEAVKVARQVYGRHITGGGSPEAQLRHMEMRLLTEWSRECAKVARLLGEEFPNHYFLENSDLSLERESIPGELTIKVPKKGDCVIECRHQVLLVPRKIEKAGGEIGLIRFEKEGRAIDNHTLWLQGVLQWLTEEKAATGVSIRLVQLNRGDIKGRNTTFTCAAMKRDWNSSGVIRDWFGKMLITMLIDNCSDHLPFKVIQKLTRPDKKGPNMDRLKWEEVTHLNLEDKLREYTCYLEAFKLTDARIPDITDNALQQCVRNRYSPMLERLVHDE